MNVDTIIIGAGVIGASTAYHLLKNNPRKKILLLDKNTRVARGNTSRSAALYRNLFSSKTSQVLATSSIVFYETIADKVSMKNLGYLWMFSEDEWKQSSQGLAKLNSEEDKFDILAPNELPKHLLLNTDGSDEFKGIYRSLYGHRCGAISAVNLTNYYATKFKELGGKMKLESSIIKINLSEKERSYPPWSDIRITSIKDQSGYEFTGKEYIFTTGAWTNALLVPLGIASQIYPKKRQMFSIKLKDSKQIVANSTEKVPILILPTGGVYVKPVLQNNLLVVGCANELGNPYQMDDYPPSASETYFQNVIAPVLHYYFPKLTNYKLFSKWAGYYANYWPDKNPVVEKVSNIQWVSGTSGSGIMKADAIGRIAAARAIGDSKVELFTNTSFNVMDLSLKKRKVDSEELII
ncbi:MAG: NAD(P)/FAD-dependent oxidoreductase [Candidatus Heimdallarchaeota archaeon]